jgi:hypothetical protein
MKGLPKDFGMQRPGFSGFCMTKTGCKRKMDYTFTDIRANTWADYRLASELGLC